jgi:hypothetical protein
MSRNKKKRHMQGAKRDTSTPSRVKGKGMSLLSKFLITVGTLSMAAVLNPYWLDWYNGWKHLVPRFRDQFKPVSTTSAAGTYYEFDYTLIVENADIWNRVATDVVFVITAPPGCSLGPGRSQGLPAAMGPLMGIIETRLQAQPLDEDKWTIARLETGQRVLISYKVGCLEPGGNRPLVCVAGKNCLGRTDGAVTAAGAAALPGKAQVVRAAETGRGSVHANNLKAGGKLAAEFDNGSARPGSAPGENKECQRGKTAGRSAISRSAYDPPEEVYRLEEDRGLERRSAGMAGPMRATEDVDPPPNDAGAQDSAGKRDLTANLNQAQRGSEDQMKIYVVVSNMVQTNDTMAVHGYVMRTSLEKVRNGVRRLTSAAWSRIAGPAASRDWNATLSMVMSTGDAGRAAGVSVSGGRQGSEATQRTSGEEQMGSGGDAIMTSSLGNWAPAGTVSEDAVSSAYALRAPWIVRDATSLVSFDIPELRQASSEDTVVVMGAGSGSEPGFTYPEAAAQGEHVALAQAAGATAGPYRWGPEDAAQLAADLQGGIARGGLMPMLVAGDGMATPASLQTRQPTAEKGLDSDAATYGISGNANVPDLDTAMLGTWSTPRVSRPNVGGRAASGADKNATSERGGSTTYYLTDGTELAKAAEAGHGEGPWEGMRVDVLSDGGANLRITAHSSPWNERRGVSVAERFPSIRSNQGVTAAVVDDGGVRLRWRIK